MQTNIISATGQSFTPRVVLFDMDGVLYDSMPNQVVAWTRAMASFGIVFTPEDPYITEGTRGVDTIRRFVLEQQGRDISEEEAKDMYAVKARMFKALPEAPQMPGALDLMRVIDSMGIHIGVVTGSAQIGLIDRIVRDYGSYVSQENIVTALDLKRGKRNPDPYLAGMAKMADVVGRPARPSEVVVVENAPLGVRSGHASGAFTIAVNTGPLADNLLLDEGADALYHSMAELAEGWKALHDSMTGGAG